jgi:hypothetical protein
MANLQDLGVESSVGLVKNVALKSTPKFTELSQGVKNSLVASVMTGNDLAVSGEMFEYTAKNMAYAMGLDGSTYTATAISDTTETLVAIDGVTIPMVATGTHAFAAGQWVAIHVNALDQIFIRKLVTGTTASSLALAAGNGLPVAIPAGSKVEVVNMVPGGSKLDQPYLAAKIVGQIADGSWVTVLLGKVRVTGGLSVAFKTDNFDNMPLSMTVYDMVTTDPNYALFTDATTGDVVKAMIFSTPVV